MASISRMIAREMLDSRGVPTIEVDVWLDDGRFGRAAAPSGGSKGRREPCELRDADPGRYSGRSVQHAVTNVIRIIAPALVACPLDPLAIDRRMIELDGTSDRSRLGANAMLAVSLAVTRALAGRMEMYDFLGRAIPCGLPVPMFNVLNGGAHAGNDVDFQEYMLAPVGASNFAEALRMGVETYDALRALLKRAGKTVAVGDEGGFAPDLETHAEAPDLLLSAVELAGLRPGADVVMAVDVAAGELYDDGTYVFRKSLRRRRTTDQMIRFYETWLKRYPIWSIEDGLAERDVEGWRALTATLGERVQLVGDDLFVTKPSLLRAGVAARLANAVLVKLNQIGTVSETMETIAEAARARYGTVISHRAGETADDFIADRAVATGAGPIKAGAPVRGERIAKYNRLLRIEETLGAKARYMGLDFAARGGFIAPGPSIVSRDSDGAGQTPE